MVRVKSVHRIDYRHITDKGIRTEDLDDAAIVVAKISAKAFQAGEDPCDSVETWITFPTAFDTTPYVAPAITTGATCIRITQRTADSFAAIADVAGSFLWMAWVR